MCVDVAPVWLCTPLMPSSKMIVYRRVLQSFMLIPSLSGVGESLDKAELVHIANQPTDDFMFLVDNYDSLDKIKEILAIKTCTGSCVTS